jgi:hypothetical protein
MSGQGQDGLDLDAMSWLELADEITHLRDAAAERDAENERLRRRVDALLGVGEDDIPYSPDEARAMRRRYAAYEHDVVVAQRDEARGALAVAERRLGAVAALLGEDALHYFPDPHGGEDEAYVDPDELRDRLGPVSGAVEGAGGDVSRERVFADFDALHDHLLTLNGEGIPPEVSGYDKLGRPVLAWLIESGGDDTWPLGATLGGEDAAQPEVETDDMNKLAYPVLVLDVSTPRTPVAGHKQEVRADDVERIREAIRQVHPNIGPYRKAQSAIGDLDREHIDVLAVGTILSALQDEVIAAYDLAARTPGVDES